MHLQLSLFFLKSAPGGNLSSADKWAVNTTRAIELFSLTVCTKVRPGRRLLPGRTSKCRVDRWIRGDRAGSPIEAAQYTMYCEAGPVKIRLAAREVPDLDPGPLVQRAQAATVCRVPAVTSEQSVFQWCPIYWCIRRCWNLQLAERCAVSRGSVFACRGVQITRSTLEFPDQLAKPRQLGLIQTRQQFLFIFQHHRHDVIEQLNAFVRGQV